MSYVPRIPCVPSDITKLRLTTAERRAHVQRLLDLRKSKFSSIHLFFNLTNPATTKNVSNYRATAAADVRSWLHEGEAITTSQFVQNYWSALSYGQFVPSVDANRDAGDIDEPSLGLHEEMVVIGDVGVEIGALSTDGDLAQQPRALELVQGVVNGGQGDLFARRHRLLVKDFGGHVTVAVAKQQAR